MYKSNIQQVLQQVLLLHIRFDWELVYMLILYTASVIW